LHTNFLIHPCELCKTEGKEENETKGGIVEG